MNNFSELLAIDDAEQAIYLEIEVVGHDPMYDSYLKSLRNLRSAMIGKIQSEVAYDEDNYRRAA